MQEIETYFRAEKKESVAFILVGGTFLAVAAFCYFMLSDEWFHGLAIAFAAIAAVELFVGTLIFLRTDGQLRDILERFAKNETGLRIDEIARMRPIILSFAIYKWGEIGFIMIGALLLTPIAHPSDLWQGFGLGLFVQGAVTLFMDSFAARRARVYRDFLERKTG